MAFPYDRLVVSLSFIIRHGIFVCINFTISSTSTSSTKIMYTVLQYKISRCNNITKNTLIYVLTSFGQS